MKTYKECGVVMLATKEKLNESNLAIIVNGINKHLYKLNSFGTIMYNDNNIDSFCYPQHLYITSDEDKPVEGWYYDSYANKVYNTNGAEYAKSDHCKQIIASTDKSLGLSEPTKQWIDTFISEYNKGNIITKVKVELVKREFIPDGLEYYCNYCGSLEKACFCEEDYFIKINEDNTINIKPVKETYTIENIIAAYKLGFDAPNYDPDTDLIDIFID